MLGVTAMTYSIASRGRRWRLTRYRMPVAAKTSAMNGQNVSQKLPPSLASSVARGMRPCNVHVMHVVSRLRELDHPAEEVRAACEPSTTGYRLPTSRPSELSRRDRSSWSDESGSGCRNCGSGDRQSSLDELDPVSTPQKVVRRVLFMQGCNAHDEWHPAYNKKLRVHCACEKAHPLIRGHPP